MPNVLENVIIIKNMPNTIKWSDEKTKVIQKIAEQDMLAELIFASKICNMDEDVMKNGLIGRLTGIKKGDSMYLFPICECKD